MAKHSPKPGETQLVDKNLNLSFDFQLRISVVNWLALSQAIYYNEGSNCTGEKSSCHHIETTVRCIKKLPSTDAGTDTDTGTDTGIIDNSYGC